MFAQQTNDSAIDYINKRFPRSQIKIVATPTIHQGYKITHEKEELLKSPFSPSLDIGMDYYQHIIKEIGISTGIHCSFIPEHYKFKIQYVNGGKEYLENDLDITSIYAVYIPVSVSLKKELNDNRLFASLDLGASFNYIDPYRSSFLLGTYDSIKVENFYGVISNDYQKWFMSYFVKFGVSNFFKNSRSALEVNLKINYTPKLIGKGTYNFSNIPKESYGDIGLRLNYVGLELIYALSIIK